MNSVDYHFLKANYTAFGRDVLEEFRIQYEAGLDLEDITKHDKDTIVKAAVKCFILYIKLNNTLS